MIESVVSTNLHTSSSPHIRQSGDVRTVMLTLLCALLPAAIASVIWFGIRSLGIMAVCISATVVSEWCIVRFRKIKPAVTDLSAICTGLLLAFNLPADIPLWIAAIGGVFASIIAKQMFGGLGFNIVNPALAARAFISISFPTAMATVTSPLNGTLSGLSGDGLMGVASAPPVSFIKNTMMSGRFDSQIFLDSLPNLLIGNAGGTVGATSTIALLAGGIFLLYRRAIGLRIPLAFIGTVFILFWLCNGSGEYFFVAACVAPVFQICSGGLLLYAFFMATDPVTTPVTPIGKICFGIGCGLLTFAIRQYSVFPENGWYSILIMNFTVPLLDRFTRPRRRGEVRIRE